MIAELILASPQVRPGEVYSAGDLPLAPNSEVPAEARRIVEQQVRASVENETKRREEEAKAIRKLSEEFRDERRKLMGLEGYSRFRAFIQEEKRRKAATPPPARMRLSDRDWQRMRREQQKRILAFVRKLKVAPHQLEAQDERMVKRVAKLIAPAPKGKGVGPIPPHKIPKHILAQQANPAADPTPPYSTLGFWTWLYKDTDQFTLSGFHWGYDKDVGTLGNTAQLEIWDASDSDHGSDTRRTLFGFWLQLPTNAKGLNIYVNAAILHGHYYQSLETEFWGKSHAWFKHENALFAEIVGVGSNQDRTSKGWWTAGSQLIYPWSEPTKGVWDSGVFTSEPMWFKMSPSLPQPVPPPNGNWVWIWVGHESKAAMWVDDEDGLGNVVFKWIINNIVWEPLT